MDSISILKLKQQKISLEELLKTIKELDNQILDLLIEEKDIETEIMEAGQYSDSISETLLKIDEALTTNQKEKEKAENVQNASSIQPNSGVTYGGANAKLPKLIIRKFHVNIKSFGTVLNLQSMKIQALAQLTSSIICEH